MLLNRVLQSVAASVSSDCVDSHEYRRTNSRDSVAKPTPFAATDSFSFGAGVYGGRWSGAGRVVQLFLRFVASKLGTVPRVCPRNVWITRKPQTLLEQCCGVRSQKTPHPLLRQIPLFNCNLTHHQTRFRPNTSLTR